MDTKQRIRKEALTLFAEKGYHAVYVGEIAEAVGIKAPSLYKHYKSKQDIFDAILDEMKDHYDKQAAALQFSGSDPAGDVSVFAGVSEDTLVQMGIGLFRFFLHDDDTSKFRKMLTIEQFHDGELARLFSQQYVDGPLSYQSALFGLLAAGGAFREGKADVMALHFYGPIYLLLTVCDRQPEREEEALRLIEAHIRQFNGLYTREKNK